LQFYGGDLPGVVAHLDHVAAVGADAIYLTPVFPAESNHRYNASTFAHVDPLLGGDAAFRELVDATHGRGWRILGDLTSNHTGDTHEWFLAARDNPRDVERNFYYFAPGGGHEGWKGYDTLPKLDHLDAELGDRFRSVVRRWLEFGLDGWRIDVANMTGRHASIDVAHAVAREIRRAAEEVHADALVIAEHGHDASGDLDGDGWPGTMNYYGFSFPVWTWLRRPEGHVPSFGLPVGVPRRTGPQAVAAIRQFTARFGWRAVTTSWNILGSHDSPRIRTTTGSAERHHAAIALQFTLPGVPMVFAGDELGLEGTDGEDSRRTMPWTERDGWDITTMGVYRAFADLRRALPALRRGGLRWVHVGDDLVVFLREHPAGDVLVAVSRGGSPALELPAARLGATHAAILYGDGTGPVDGDTFTVPASPHAAAYVWRLGQPSDSSV
jgi:alpha-glucosidase